MVQLISGGPIATTDTATGPSVGAQLVIKTGDNWDMEVGDWFDLTVGEWTEVSWNMADDPSWMSGDAHDPTAVRELGLQLSSGSDGTYEAAVIAIDTVSVE